MPRFTIPRTAHCDGGALPVHVTRPARLPSRAGAFLPHIRRYWPAIGRRVLVDSHDLRLGLFYVPGESAWLHLPGIVIQLRGPE